jgi:hypothetical protein
MVSTPKELAHPLRWRRITLVFSLQQALRKMETDSKSSPANPDIKLVTIDVKMQIRALHAVCKHNLDIPNLNS